MPAVLMLRVTNHNHEVHRVLNDFASSLWEILQVAALITAKEDPETGKIDTNHLEKILNKEDLLLQHLDKVLGRFSNQK